MSTCYIFLGHLKYFESLLKTDVKIWEVKKNKVKQSPDFCLENTVILSECNLQKIKKHALMQL